MTIIIIIIIAVVIPFYYYYSYYYIYDVFLLIIIRSRAPQHSLHRQQSGEPALRHGEEIRAT